ncbi:hypothetical protein SAMN05660284_01771 [Formivibrio citricus]|uniref:Uncharacterized protein n=1 Tax=Formivibrio citricus TaxID=83765 RepID=A0A1I5A1X3_9NEIS|nr:hypothetical protein SAMN05660284_01771 [Formivibrio citricus]
MGGPYREKYTYRFGRILFELVTPAQAGVQWFEATLSLDTGLRRYDGKNSNITGPDQ